MFYNLLLLIRSLIFYNLLQVSDILKSVAVDQASKYLPAVFSVMFLNIYHLLSLICCN
jgi:hypothetical protein